MRRIAISPSLQCADPLYLGETVAQLEGLGAEGLHIDLMDMHFVPNLALSFDTIAALKRATAIPVDVHLMAEPVEAAVQRALLASADRVCWHVENSADHRGLIAQVHGAGRMAGLAISPETEVERVTPYLPLIDYVLVMAVTPGFAGQSFLPQTLARVECLAQARREAGAEVLICVDGGIDASCGRACIRAGADMLIAGAKCVFLPGEDVGANFVRFRREMEGAVEKAPGELDRREEAFSL